MGGAPPRARPRPSAALGPKIKCYLRIINGHSYLRDGDPDIVWSYARDIVGKPGVTCISFEGRGEAAALAAAHEYIESLRSDELAAAPQRAPEAQGTAARTARAPPARPAPPPSVASASPSYAPSPSPSSSSSSAPSSSSSSSAWPHVPAPPPATGARPRHPTPPPAAELEYPWPDHNDDRHTGRDHLRRRLRHDGAFTGGHPLPQVAHADTAPATGHASARAAHEARVLAARRALLELEQSYPSPHTAPLPSPPTGHGTILGPPVPPLLNTGHGDRPHLDALAEHADGQSHLAPPPARQPLALPTPGDLTTPSTSLGALVEGAQPAKHNAPPTRPALARLLRAAGHPLSVGDEAITVTDPLSGHSGSACVPRAARLAAAIASSLPSPRDRESDEPELRAQMVNVLSGSAALAGRLPPSTTAPQHGTGPLPWFSLFAAGHVPLHDSLHNIHITTVRKGVATLHDLYSVRGATRTLFFAAVLGEAGRPGHAYDLSAPSCVATPRAAASVAAEAQRAWRAASAQTVLCSGCGKGDGDATMLLCDASLPPCGVGYHLACCSPPLASPPAGHWYCPTHSWGSLAARPSLGGGLRRRRSEEPTPQVAAPTPAPTSPGGDSVTPAAARRASLHQAAAARREARVLRAARRAGEAAAAAAIPLEPPSCMLSPPFRTLRGSLLAPPAPREQPSRSVSLAGSRTTPPRPPAFVSCVSPLRQFAGVFANYGEALAHGIRTRGTHFAITGPFLSFEVALADTRARVAAAVHALPGANLGVSAGASVTDGTQPFPHVPDQVGPPLHTPPRSPPSYGGSSCSQDECTQPAPPDDDLPDGEDAPDTSPLAAPVVTPTTTLPSPQGATPPTAGAPIPPSPRPPSPHPDGATPASSPRSARLLFLVGIPPSASCVCGSNVPALQSTAWSSLLRSATATSASGGPPLGIRVLPEGGLIITNVDGTHLLDPSAAEPACSGVHLELLARSIRSLALFHGQVLPPFDITLGHTPRPTPRPHQERYPAFGDAGLLGATASPALTLLAHNIEQQLCELGDVRASSNLAVWLGAVNSTLAPDFIALSEVGRRFDGSGLHTLGFDPAPHGFYIAAAACRAEPGSAMSGPSAQVVQGGGVMLLAALRWLPFDASRKPGAPGPPPSASPALAVCDFRTSTGLLSVVAAYLPTYRPDSRHAAETSSAIATLDALLHRVAKSPSSGLTHDFVGLGDWNVALPSCTAGLATPGTADTALDFTFTAFNEARGLTPNARLLYGLMGKHKLAPLCDVGTTVSATFAGKGVVPPSAIDWVMGAGAMRNDPRAYHVLHLQSPTCPPCFTADSQLGAATMQLQGAAEDHFPVLCSIGVPWTCAALLPPPPPTSARHLAVAPASRPLNPCRRTPTGGEGRGTAPGSSTWITTSTSRLALTSPQRRWRPTSRPYTPT